jgi:hypothetical protein
VIVKATRFSGRNTINAPNILPGSNFSISGCEIVNLQTITSYVPNPNDCSCPPYTKRNGLYANELGLVDIQFENGTKDIKWRSL